MFDMMKMMSKLKEVQARIKESQDKLGSMYATGESGAGLVKAKVSGKKQLITLDIDSSLLKAEDKTILQDRIVAAVNKATEEAEALAKEEMRKSTEGLLPTIGTILRNAVVAIDSVLHRDMPMVETSHPYRCRSLTDCSLPQMPTRESGVLPGTMVD